ncbi:hypothetical protein AUK40_02610 [Candidatus Wirthbacteria bacterium CG2_30_54_11]|uniref:Metal-dependent hydrolase n=1 Tax=Candidatus Wirthbacteria bacterium CG2_30_54_11 TaxID=1817892 RepID=A0A1J5IL04_9BACT|nr:MAG: hypothetical protein AUK40_02610 [Candidatus Wirthbacteria bacterium CG2_30_54_11]
MLTPGHIAASYLISQIPKKKLPSREIWFIVICGSFLDLDFLLLMLSGYPGGLHHHFIIHTPLFALLLFILIIVFTRHRLSTAALALGLVALLGHLVLDDLNYWMGLAGLAAGVSATAQIRWEYPLDSGRVQALALTAGETAQRFTSMGILTIYLRSKLFLLEIATISAGLFVFLRQLIKPGPWSHLPGQKH